MVTRIQSLIKYLDDLLTPEKFRDYCPNGLQVEGRAEIKKIITGVTACQKLLDQAVVEHADAILVHHGFFWREEDPRIIGIKKRRIATILKNNINLITYHLPLDAHPVYGNNVQLAQKLGLRLELAPDRDITDIIFIGSLAAPTSAEDFVSLVAKKLQRMPLYIAGSGKMLEKVAICSGGAQDYFQKAVQLDVDAFLTGEISEQVVHLAREMGVDYIAAGHHATEKFGIRALGEHVAEKFDLEYKFIDIENPV